MHLANLIWAMSFRHSGPEQRRAPRIDVLTRIRGEVIALDVPITVYNLSRTGFAVLSEQPFPIGAHLTFRLDDFDGPPVTVTAEAMHTRPNPATPGLHLSGFRFVPGALTGMVPQAAIDRLIATVTAAPLFA